MAVTEQGTAYELTGPADAPVVVLIHGLGLTGERTWSPIARLLKNRFRVLSYDLPGHGASVLPDAPVTLTALSEQLIALLDALGIEKAALAGFSLGGMINRRCAMDHPGRVSALAILNSPHERGDERQKLVESQARDASAGGPGATIDAALERWFTPDFRQRHKAIVDDIRAVVLNNDASNYASHRQVLAEGVKELIRPDPPIAHKALVITCEHDSGSTPGMSEAIGKEIAGAGVEIVPGLRHLGLIERPGLFADRLEAFLDRALTE